MVYKKWQRERERFWAPISLFKLEQYLLLFLNRSYYRLNETLAHVPVSDFWNNRHWSVCWLIFVCSFPVCEQTTHAWLYRHVSADNKCCDHQPNGLLRWLTACLCCLCLCVNWACTIASGRQGRQLRTVKITLLKNNSGQKFCLRGKATLKSLLYTFVLGAIFRPVNMYQERSNFFVLDEV